MKLEATGKYLLWNRVNRISSSAFLFLFLVLSLEAQTYRMTFVNKSLADALVETSEQLKVKVAFDSEKLSIVNISKEVTGETPDQFISDLLKNTGFTFQYKYNRYLITVLKNSDSTVPSEKYQIIGSVSDKETGEHLPFATVILYNKNLLTSASESGSFSIKDISSNPVRISVSYIGYNELDTLLNITGPTMNVDLVLNRKINLLDTIVVKGLKMEMVDLRNDVDFATTIDPAKLIDLPLLAETDIFRTLQLLPGVSYGENSSGLSIRGGTSDQNLVLFDGQTLYNLSHYYGVISALNPNVIKDLQIYKGGYDSRFGERVSGIVDITGKSGNQTKPTLYGDINLLSVNLTTEIPMGKKVTLLGAMRRSYSDIYSTGFADGLLDRNISWLKPDSMTIINETKPTYYFYDYNARVTFRPSNVENFVLSYYGGKDYFKNSYTGDTQRLQVDATDKDTWSNYGLSAAWLRQWNESFYSNLQIGASGYGGKSSNTTVITRLSAPVGNEPYLPDSINVFNTFNQNELKDIYLSGKANLTLSDVNQLNFGILVRENTIYYHKDAETIYIYDNTNQKGWTTSAYIQDRMTVNDKLTLKPGLRISYFNNMGRWFVEPRFSLNYKFSDLFSARIATGRYYQFINQVLAQEESGYNKNFWVLADGSLHPEVSSTHFIGGFTFEKGRFLFDAEAYYKSYTGLQEYFYISQFLKNSDFHHYFPEGGQPGPGNQKASYFLTGKGRSYGFDLMIRYKNRVYTSWISYSYGRSLQNFARINNNADIPSLTDQPNQVSWTNMLSAGKWNFGTITLYSTGKPYIESARPAASQSWLRNYKRLPDYFRTDLSVNYNFAISRAKFKTGLTFLNIFNTQNYFDINSRKFDFNTTTFSQITLVPSQSFSVNFFIHFVF